MCVLLPCCCHSKRMPTLVSIRMHSLIIQRAKKTNVPQRCFSQPCMPTSHTEAEEATVQPMQPIKPGRLALIKVPFAFGPLAPLLAPLG